MDKLKQIIRNNKKSIIFLFILIVIALLTGSFFNIILNEADKKLVQESINTFLNNLDKLNYLETLKTGLLNQSLFILIIWLLGFSIIGIPIILFSFLKKRLKSFLMINDNENIRIGRWLYLKNVNQNLEKECIEISI